MTQRHCMQRTDLNDICQQTSIDLMAAALVKRRAMAMSSREQWTGIARRFEEARLEYDHARCIYIEHLVTNATGCSWRVRTSMNSLAIVPARFWRRPA